ncbi:hypothetical protein PM082_005824 [Marasmius tenuissimus]|nr:hypothetical protein PM082_005824 [Marasmius tenuissimus]
MKLLHYSTLSPQGPSGLSAIRFSAPIRVSLIRIFPSGAQPFDLSPDVIAKTEPESFYLDVFFNAQPLKPAESKEKQRAPNALVPTSIAYAGGQAEFTMDLGTEYATRLMIIKGQFDFVSIAVYGTVVTDAQPALDNPEQVPAISNPQPDPVPLSRLLDVANAKDPTELAQQLLSLVPDPPSLPLASRLVLCMKPDTDDWEDPSFPHLYADLERELDSEDLILEDAVDCLSRPIPEEISREVIAKFWQAVASSIQSQNSTRQSSLIAQLFKLTSSQHPSLALELCLHIDPQVVFDQNSLDSDSLLDLLDAAANADIARHLNSPSFLDILQEIQDNSSHDLSARKAARRLAVRITSWDTFEDSLTNTQADFDVAVAMIKDIGSEEQSLGIWLASMTLHDDLVTKLSDNPANLQRYPKLFGRGASSSVSHDDFIALVRGYVGIASVFAVWSWADSLGNDMCRERILAVLHLWQGVDGYHELVNFFLLLRQFSLRLKWIASDNEIPRKSGVLGEQILADLVEDPLVVLHEDVNQAILALEEPLSYISEAELLSMRELAYVAEDGLAAAIEEIYFTSARPLSLCRLRTLRLSLAMVKRELGDSDGGEWRIIETVRDDYSVPFMPRLVQLLQDVSSDLDEYFVVSQRPPAPLKPTLVEHLFRTVEELLGIITQLSSQFLLTTVILRNLTLSVADIFACTDAAGTVFYPDSAACASAEAARQLCIDIMLNMSGLHFRVEPNRKLGAEVVLRALLTHALESHERDPVYHLQQVFSLINHVLPVYTPDNQAYDEWLCSVLPAIQAETLEFFHLLDLEHKVPFMKRLVELDPDGLVGFGEWLFIEELRYATTAVRELIDTGNRGAATQVTLGHHINLQLHFLRQILLFKTDKAFSSWCFDLLGPSSSAPDAAQAFSAFMLETLEARIVSSVLNELVQLLIEHSSPLASDMKNAVLLAGLRISQRDVDLVQWNDLATLLQSLPSPPLTREATIMRREIGQTLLALSKPGIPLSNESATVVVAIMEWLTAQEDKHFTQIPGLKADEMTTLFDKLASSLPSESEKLSGLRSSLSVDEDELFLTSDIKLVESIEMSIRELESLLKHEDTVERPSTPTRNNVPDVLGLVFSPPTAVLRSPEATGLTKTYTNNEFRDLRATPTARQNTSRLPSTHGELISRT